ncbi:MAG TPA: thioredoxin domain-containing protein [Candidatus Nanoarchaeia archaeon]|nr:thioredoxin domain-containing protein [Candidatus Nanoarchaeia archaeon]
MTYFEKEGHEGHDEHHHTFSHEPKATQQPAAKASSGAAAWSGFQKFLAVAVVVQIALSLYLVNGLSGLSGIGDSVGSAPTGAAVAPTPSPAPTVDVEALLDDDAVKGDKDAPVTIVEFSDYECPFCARFYSETLGQIDEQYNKTGKVKLIYRDFPLSFHQQAQKAAEAAECAGEQGKYYEMHDKLFGQGVQGGVASFKAYAKDLGLNSADFDSCLDSGKMATEIRKDMSDGSKAGVQGTPAFFVNGVLVSGAQPFSAFQQVIESQLN